MVVVTVALLAAALAWEVTKAATAWPIGSVGRVDQQRPLQAVGRVGAHGRADQPAVGARQTARRGDQPLGGEPGQHLGVQGGPVRALLIHQLRVLGGWAAIRSARPSRSGSPVLGPSGTSRYLPADRPC
jgi:hypothetical protein